MKKMYAGFVVLLVMVSLAACGGTNQTVDLEGSSWLLVAYGGSAPIGMTMPTLAFQDGQVSGNASCNSFGGSYEVKGDSISFGAMFMTEMFCMEPEGVMDQESLYLQLLGSAERFEVSDGQLVLFTATGETLNFIPAE